MNDFLSLASALPRFTISTSFLPNHQILVLFLGALLSGIGHSGLCKLFSALNSPPPVDENLFTDTLRYIQPILSSFKDTALSSAAERQ